MNTADRPILEAPNGAKKLLLHSCCAPCEGEVLETLLCSGIQPTVFFYNPNIHPKKEYEIRKEEDKRFCEKMKIDHIDVDYDPHSPALSGDPCRRHGPCGMRSLR